MRNDISLIFEAYKKVQEAAGETGAVTSPVTTQQQAPNTSNVTPTGSTQNTAKGTIELNLQDAKKIIKNISDIYTKAKDNASILQKNSVPGAQDKLKREIDNLSPYIINIVNSTAATGSQKLDLVKGLEPEIASIVNRAFSQKAWQGHAEGGKYGGELTPPAQSQTSPITTPSTTPTTTPPSQPNSNSSGSQASISKSPGAPINSIGVRGGITDTPEAQVPTTGTPVPDDTVAPATAANEPETVAPPAPASGEEPVRRATLADEGPYYVMTTKGPRMTTKGTPGAYQINRPRTNK